MNVEQEPLEAYKEFITEVQQQSDDYLDRWIWDCEEDIREMEEEAGCLQAELKQEMKDLKKYVELVPENGEKAIERYEEAKENLEERMDEVRENISSKRSVVAILRYESARRRRAEMLRITQPVWQWAPVR
jgi:ElaB/YqjD/DUF883 family membrane-anchored ribosome-binding protein